jgi:uncharacterized membrane protein HdeD (DUF308 family)
MTQSSVALLPNQHRGWVRALGIAWIAFGVLAIAMPLAASIAIELLVGALLLVGGVAQTAQVFRLHGWGGRVLALCLGILYAVAGLILLAFPLGGLITLTIVLAAYFFAGGLTKLVLAFRLRAAEGRGGFLVSGVLGLVLGMMLWLGFPSTAAWAIGTLVGIDMIFGGFALWGVASAASSPPSPASNRA